MEFAFDVSGVLPSRVTVINSRDTSSSLQIYDAESGHFNQEGDGSWTYTLSSNIPWDLKIKKRKDELENVIDLMGYASAQAQNLQTPVTTLKKMLNSSQQKLYIIRDVEEPNFIIGMLKVGIKRLFVCDSVGAHHEVDPLCVLDFYVHESKQRCGFGHELFDVMLKAEGIEPEKLAIDRPSYKCLAFLQKHYNLNDPIQQNNNFVIYSNFLQDRPVTRPPIFLYTGKALDRPNGNSKEKNNSKHSIQDSIDAFHSVPVSLCASDLKSKTFYSSGHFLNGNTCDSNQEYHKKRVQDTNNFPISPNINSFHKENWGVRDAMHSYTTSTQEHPGWKNLSSSSFLTPVDSVQYCTPKRWNQLQSSWNVLGVKPLDYAPFQKKD